MIYMQLTWPKDDVRNYLSKLNDKVISNIDAALYDASEYYVRSYAIKHISGGTRSGKITKVGIGTHQASVAGEWPKTDSGRLVGSIHVAKAGFLSYDVGTNVKYGEYLEVDLDRSFLRRSVAENANNIDKFINNAVGKALG